MINFQYFDLFGKGSADKQWKIEYDGGVIKNESLFSQSVEITESICSESELRFGCCEASELKFKIGNVIQSLLGKWLTVSVVLDHNEDAPFVVGTYKVVSDKVTSDRRHREVVAYDAMYSIINTSAIDWYNATLPNKNSKVTMKQFRTSFISYFGLEQEDIELVNDDMIVEKTIEVQEGVEVENEEEQTSILTESALSGLDVISAICEINGCFGHIGRDGKFQYIYLPQKIQGLYPANDLYPADDLFPIEPKTSSVGGDGTYIGQPQYENFFTKEITKLQIRKSENEIGKVWPEDDIKPEDNCYVIEDNFLVYGKSTEELRVIAQNLYNKITGITYMPLLSCEAVGNPCFEVGDAIRISTKYELIETYILERTLKGIQALRDTYKSNGVEEYSEKVNSVHNSIIQLKGKTNTLSRTIEETKLEITNTEKGLQTQITQNAESIKTEADRAKKKEEEINGAIVKTNEELSSKIEQTAEKITQSVDKKISETKEYADGKIEESSTELSSKIEETAENIKSTVSATYETKTDASATKEEFSSKIEQTAKDIEEEVSARTKEGEEIKASLALKIDKDDDGTIVSLINGTGDKIHFGANNMFTVDSPNFSIDDEGNISFSGIVKNSVVSEGEIVGTEINNGNGTFRVTEDGKVTMQECDVNGRIVGREGFYTEYYIDDKTRVEFKFLDAGYDSSGGYLSIKGPNGTDLIRCGSKYYQDVSNPLPLAIPDIPIFSNGLYAEGALVTRLIHIPSPKYFGSNGEDWVEYEARDSGAFISISGGYHSFSHGAGETKSIQLDSNASYIPRYTPVMAVGNSGGTPFVFSIDTSGLFTAINAGIYDINEEINVYFRFDFFRF